MKTLVIYFSAETGKTKAIAEELAQELKACAEESAMLDEKMLRIRDRISADAAASDCIAACSV